MNEKTKKILLVFTIILFGGFGIYLTFISGNMNQFDSQTRAYKIEVVERTGSDDTTYAPVYYYRVKGEIYTCESQISGSNYPNLKKNIVYYDSKNPEKCLTQYEKTSGRTFGIIMLALSILIAVLSIRKPSTVSNSSKSNVPIDKETQYKMEEQAEKAMILVDKAQILFKRIILGIIIFVLFLFILFDVAIIKQTIKAKDYIDVTATYLEPKEVEEDQVFVDYIYTFEDKNGVQQKITFSCPKDEAPEDTIQIKYNPNDPKDYYEKGSTYGTSGIIWFVVKVLVLIFLIYAFSNKKLLSKIGLSVSRD